MRTRVSAKRVRPLTRLAQYVLGRARRRQSAITLRLPGSLAGALTQHFQRAVRTVVSEHLAAGRSVAVELNGELQLLRADTEVTAARQVVVSKSVTPAK